MLQNVGGAMMPPYRDCAACSSSRYTGFVSPVDLAKSTIISWVTSNVPTGCSTPSSERSYSMSASVVMSSPPLKSLPPRWGKVRACPVLDTGMGVKGLCRKFVHPHLNPLPSRERRHMNLYQLSR